jgi:cation diffusion facilitator CzcD-associated flavoprotein CzcO
VKPHIAILGAGPIGLEAALAAAEGGFPFTLYEAAPAAGGNVERWGHVRMFTPWSLNVSARAHRALGAAGETPAPDACPTGRELVDRLLAPLAGLPALAPHVRFSTRVLAVGRQGLLKHEEISTAARGRRRFRLLLADPAGGERIETADVLLDTTGTYGHPNSLGDGGIPAPGESALGERIERCLPDLQRDAGAWAGRTILLAGGGHSAQTAARDLADLAHEAPGTRVVWVLRQTEPSFQAVDGDPLPARAALTARARGLAGGASPAVDARRGAVVEALERANGRTRVHLRRGDTGEPVVVDRILSLTGDVGDHGLYRQLQVHECYATCGPIKLSAALLGAAAGDCLAQTTHGAETLVNPEPGFFLLGSKSYGRNTTFLLRVGYAQVDEVFGLLG